MARALAAVLLTLLSACASIETYPRRACLYGPDRRAFDIGTIIARRDDGARLFKFDDSNRGDHGFAWIADDDDRHHLMPCRAASMWPGAADNTGGFLNERHR